MNSLSEINLDGYYQVEQEKWQKRIDDEDKEEENGQDN